MKKEKILGLSVIIISLFGILMIYSSSYIWATYKYDNPLKYVINQSVFFIIGIIIMKVVSKIDYKKYKEKSNIILLICFILLILVLIPGIGVERNGSRSWFGIGSLGIQPSEISKIGLIIFTAKYLSKNEKDKKNTKSFIWPILIVIFLLFPLKSTFDISTPAL